MFSSKKHLQFTEFCDIVCKSPKSKGIISQKEVSIHMLEKKWCIQEFDKARVVEIAGKFQISPLTAVVMYNRGICEDNDVEKFLSKDFSNLYDPFLLKDMKKAVDRIKLAIERKEKITIYGDYDVDGITSIVILHKHLTYMGLEVAYYIPDRTEEGYGINKEALKRIKEDGTTLIITVDTGITACDEAVFAAELGIDLIITDHHECKEQTPNAIATIDPKQKDCNYPFKNLAGVGVVFKLICALEAETELPALIEKYSDLLCLGTVADIAPLVDENRIMVTEGLARFKNSKNIGLHTLMEMCAANVKKVTTTTIGYIIAPRINASGRLGCASRSADLFLTDDAAEAEKLAKMICEENTVRQETEHKMFAEALEYIENNPEILNDKVLVIAHENWHNGIVGIVSSKITEKFYKPSILFAVDGKTAKGSGRGLVGFNLFEALENSSDLLNNHGGHELAAGLSINTENIEKFRKKINEYAKDNMIEDAKPVINVDAVVKVPFITMEMYHELNRLQPYGQGNSAPIFAINGIKIHRISQTGEGRHLRMTLLKDKKYFDAVGFGMGDGIRDFHEGDYIDVVFGIDINDYRGMVNLQLVLRDMRKAVQ